MNNIYGNFFFLTQRKTATSEKLISNARQKIKQIRNTHKLWLLERAKSMQTTALFESKLIPDWEKLMSDDLQTLSKILNYAIRCATCSTDFELINKWHKKYLGCELSTETQQSILEPNFSNFTIKIKFLINFWHFRRYRRKCLILNV